MTNETPPGQQRAQQVLEPFNEKQRRAGKEVIVIDIRMPFWSMVIFMVKWAIASIPAILMLVFFFAIPYFSALDRLRNNEDIPEMLTSFVPLSLRNFVADSADTPLWKGVLS